MIDQFLKEFREYCWGTRNLRIEVKYSYDEQNIEIRFVKYKTYGRKPKFPYYVLSVPRGTIFKKVEQSDDK